MDLQSRTAKRTLATALSLVVLLIPTAMGGPTGVSASSPVPTANQLVQALDKAKTSQARVQALENIFATIGLGVRDSHLHIIVAGGEKKASDFYLYKAELYEMADAVKNGWRNSFDGLAAQLATDGVLAKPPSQYQAGTPLTGQQVESMVQTHDKYWAGRSGDAALYAELIRDLGLARHVDLTKPVSSTAEVLDPVQQLLVTMGMMATTKPTSCPPSWYYCSGGDVARPGGLGHLTGGILRYAQKPRRAGDCNFQSAGAVVSALAGAKKFAGYIPAVGDLVSDAITVIPDIGHAVAEGIFVDIVPKSPHVVTGAFGQHGLYSGKDMVFKVQAYNYGHPTDDQINCGALAGYTFPQHGPVAGIRVDFDTNSAYLPGYPLNFFAEGDCSNKKTSPRSPDGNHGGIATCSFSPDTEYLPNTGPVYRAHGYIDAKAYVYSGLGNGTGAVLENIGGTKDTTFSWFISWHQPRGYEIDLPPLTIKEVDPNGHADSWRVTAHNMAVCLGDRPPKSADPLEPEGEYTYYPSFGGGKLKNDPDNGYFTGTHSWSGYGPPDPSGSNPIDPNSTHFTSIPVVNDEPLLWDFGNVAGGDSPVDGSVEIRDVRTWKDGHAGEQVTITVNPKMVPKGWTVSPLKQGPFNVPWKEATSCPMPPPYE